jgi:hypothetical protein
MGALKRTDSIATQAAEINLRIFTRTYMKIHGNGAAAGQMH